MAKYGRRRRLFGFNEVSNRLDPDIVAFISRVEADGGSVESAACLSNDLTFLKTNPVYTGLLDTYGGAAAAYSLRQLSSTYSGDAIVVTTNGSDSQSIGFVNNELDTVSLEAFAGSGDAYVATWYDQSGGGNDAIQSTFSSMPKIVSSGSTILENGKAAIDFLGVTQTNLKTPAITAIGQPYTFVDVVFANNDNQFIRDGLTSTDRSALYIITTTRYAAGLSATYTYTNNQQSLYFTRVDGASTDMAQNGSAFETRDAGSNSLTGINIGGVFDNASLPFKGKYQELILYPLDQSSNRTGIETNIAQFYGITLP